MKIAIEWPVDLIIGTSSQLLAEQLRAHREAGYEVIMDFTSCKYIDSAGLSMLVGTTQAAWSAGRRIVVCGLNADFEMLFEMTQLKRMLWPVKNIAAARERLAGQDPPPEEPPSGERPTLSLMP